MGFLDRLRPVPRWKHVDPAVRMAAVHELAGEELEALPSIVKDDPDPSVRKAAVGRLDDPAALASVAETDTDEDVRGKAVDLLLALALREGDEGDRLSAVASLARGGHSKSLQVVAKGAAVESVGRSALTHLLERNPSDAKAIGSVARQSPHATVRLEALARLRDPVEVAAVALKSEHKDVALAALESVSDPSALEAVATRGRNKMAARRARALLRALQPVPEDPDVSLPLVESGPSVVEDPTEPVALVVDLEKLARDRAEQERQRQLQEEQQRTAAAARVAFEEERQRREHEAAAERPIKLSELLQKATDAAERADTAAALQEWRAIRKAWQATSSSHLVEPEMLERYQALDATFAAREAADRETRVEQQREHLVRLQQLADRVARIAQNDVTTLKEAERALRDLRGALAHIGSLPSKADHHELVERFSTLQQALTPKLETLRQVDEWERWANAGLQEEICRKVEALRECADPASAAKQLRDAKEQWKKIGPVPHARAQGLWLRLKAAEDVVRAQCESYFAEQTEARSANLARKQALCEQAEALAESTAWIPTAETIKGLQAEWKTVGPALPGHEKAVWERFRRACDRFFTRRKEDLAQRKEAWSTNLARKEALCQQAEALVESTEWEQAATELRRLQTEWKTVGPVKRTRADAIWQRFRGACDRFFERYAHRDQLRLVAQVGERERLCQEIEALLPTAAGEGSVPVPVPNLQKIQGLRTQWLGAPPIPRHQAEPLTRQFVSAIATLIEAYPALRGSDIDPEANRKKLEQLCVQVEALLGPEGAAIDRDMSPAVMLAKQWREALAANTMGAKVDDEAKWRTGDEEIRRAQQTWRRVWPVPDEAAQPLADRFQRACQKFYRKRDERRRPSSMSAR